MGNIGGHGIPSTFCEDEPNFLPIYSRKNSSREGKSFLLNNIAC